MTIIIFLIFKVGKLMKYSLAYGRNLDIKRMKDSLAFEIFKTML